MNKPTQQVATTTAHATAGRKAKAIRLRPAPARPWAAAPGRGLNSCERQQLLAALLSAHSFDAACLAAGVARGDALLARAHNPAFAAAWDQTMEARIAEVTARLTDLAIGGLQRALAPGEDARAAIALGQWLVEGRRATASKAGRAAGMTAAGSEKVGSEKVGSAPAVALPAAEAARRVDALFTTVEQRLRMAEALSASKG